MPAAVEGEDLSVRKFREFQQKSAAIETIFTLALLYVSILQIFPLRGLVRYLAMIPVAVLLATALLIGGDNLWNQIQESI